MTVKKFIGCIIGQIILVFAYLLVMLSRTFEAIGLSVVDFYRTSKDMWTYQPKEEDKPWE